MTVKIEVKQTRSAEPDGKYRVRTEVTYASSIDPAIFVHDPVTDAFSHVAYPYDMLEYPSSEDGVVAEGVAYYRSIVAEVLYDDVVTATTAAAYTLSRVEWLATQYEKTVDGFVGDSEHNFEG